MWHPEPGWRQLPGAAGPSTYGVWRSEAAGRQLVIKRLSAPGPHDPLELSNPRHPAYWRREVELALGQVIRDTPGLCGAPVLAVDEDADGATITTQAIEEMAHSGLFIAAALGRFAGWPPPVVPWLALGQLSARLASVERAGGWPTLARTTVADVADRLWSRRAVLLKRLDELPQVAQHGDPVPKNLPGRDGERIVAIDWGSLGLAAVGVDLGYFALSAREDFEPLVAAYHSGLPAGCATREEVAVGARVSAVYTVLSRAEWALARVAGGNGALAGKYRHPSVAPHLRALQRQFPQIEALL
jgi:Phosphotransferase enzyme family